DARHLGEGFEFEIGLEQVRAQGVIGDAKARHRVVERLRGERPEVLMAPHQACGPGVFELPRAPQLGQGLRRIPDARRLARDRAVHVEERAVGVEDVAADGLAHSILLERVLPLRGAGFCGAPGGWSARPGELPQSFAASTSTGSICGGLASNSGALAMSACAMRPLRCACRPASSAKASKTPKVEGPSLSANHTRVCSSWLASASAPTSRSCTAA